MNKGISLRRNFSWTLAGNAVYAATQWGILISIAKIMNPEAVGQFSLGLAITAPVILLTGLQLRALLSTDVREQYIFHEYFTLRITTLVVALCIIIGIVFFSRYSHATSLIILSVGIAKCVESISDILYGLFQKHEKMDMISQSMIIKGILSLVSFVIVLYISKNLIWGISAIILSWITILIAFDLKNALHLKCSNGDCKNYVLSALRNFKVINHKKIAALTKVALPMGIVMMIGSLNSNVPRYFLERYAGEASVGYFSAISYLMVAGTMIINAIGQTASPRLAKYAVQSLDLYKKLIVKLVGLSCIVGVFCIIVAVFFGREILTIFYRSDYANYNDVLIWMSISTVISWITALLGVGLTSARNFKVQMYISLFSVGVLILLSAIFIPSNGIIGTAWAFFISTSVTTTVWVIVFIRFMKKQNSYLA